MDQCWAGALGRFDWSTVSQCERELHALNFVCLWSPCWLTVCVVDSHFEWLPALLRAGKDWAAACSVWLAQWLRISPAHTADVMACLRVVWLLQWCPASLQAGQSTCIHASKVFSFVMVFFSFFLFFFVVTVKYFWKSGAAAGLNRLLVLSHPNSGSHSQNYF